MLTIDNDKYENSVFTVYDEEEDVAMQLVSYCDVVEICMEYENEIRRLKNKLENNNE